MTETDSSKVFKMKCVQSTTDQSPLTFDFVSTNRSHGQNKIKSSTYCIYEPSDLCEGYPHGGHLVSCENHICRAEYFKCPGYYCIAWRYVCNNKWECPGGMDELDCNRTACPGMFRCKDSVISKHKSKSCNFFCKFHNGKLHSIIIPSLLECNAITHIRWGGWGEAGVCLIDRFMYAAKNILLKSPLLLQREAVDICHPHHSDGYIYP